MNKIYLFNLILFTTFVSCQSKQENNLKAQLGTLNVELTETFLSSKADSIDLTDVLRLTQKEYDDLQLSKVKGLEGYELSDLTMGQVLLDNANGTILTIQIITDGEITEYLLSYDKDGNLVDNLIVAYEDMVEYYSEISSKINSDLITVQTVNFTYGDEDGNQTEASDTAIAKYQITPEFKFVMN
ncbi:MAG: hypothetical protein ACK5KL_02310 [Dysgonomonas sp.]|jgi:hypothetical protein|nr:hypothetical protein [Prevotella sp.]MDR3060279.1 hypothetical protein [Prevotella sp.]